MRETLRADGRVELADQVGRFLKGMPPPQTEREWLAHALFDRAREAYRPDTRARVALTPPGSDTCGGRRRVESGRPTERQRATGPVQTWSASMTDTGLR